jgi:hypothetical protein
VAMNFLRWIGMGHRPIVIEDMKIVCESWQKEVVPLVVGIRPAAE